MKTVIQDKFLNIQQCMDLMRQYESASYYRNKAKKPIEKFDSFYPWNHSYQGNNQGNCPLWWSKKINNLATEINGSVVDWIETVKWYSPCPGKSLHFDDASDKTTLACIIYLNSDYDGGQTYFEDGTVRKLSLVCSLTCPTAYGEGELILDTGAYKSEEERYINAKEKMPKGSILVMTSDTYHKVNPITSGKRYSMVFWARCPKFK